MKGTICKIGEFLNDDKFTLNISVGGIMSEYIKFEKGRKIDIPMYQREIKWREQHVNQLLSDILIESKFLGNIFLSEEAKGYELIDGQQRLTTLYILIKILKEEYSHISNIFQDFLLVNVQNESFMGFDDTTKFNDIYDPYAQKERYLEIHNFIKEFLNKQTNENIINFCRNVFESKINVIILDYGDSHKPIDGFIDINVKGVKLDDEDIIKGYIFKATNNKEEIKEMWVDLKTKYFKLKKLDSKVKFTDMLYNVIFCFLKNDVSLKKISDANIDKDFRLVNNINVTEKSQVKNYEKGTHIMELIHEYYIIEQFLKSSIGYVDICLKFLSNNITCHSSDFLNSFGLSDLDSSVRSVYFHMLNMLIRNDVAIYNFLATYCYINGTRKYVEEKNECKKIIYYSYFYAFIFDALSTRKGVHSITPKISDAKSYCRELLSLISSSLTNGTNPKINFAQNMNSKGIEGKKSDIKAKFTMLYFATLFDCFKIDKENRELIFTAEKFNSIIMLSNEHFIVNNSGKYEVDNKEFQYTAIPKKMKNNFINLMPIEKGINDDLGNKHIIDKIKVIKGMELNDALFWDKYGTKYSKCYFEIIDKFITEHNESVEDVFDNALLILDEIYKEFRKKIEFSD